MKELLALIQDMNHAESYMRYLKEMGRALSANVQMLYVESPNDYPVGVPDPAGSVTANLQISRKEQTERAREKLGKLIRDINENGNQGIRMEYAIETGDIIDVLEKYITDPSDCMIVMKNDGNGSLWERKNDDMRVIRQVNCPVWIIPEEIEFEQFDEIVYATDYNEEDLETIQKLIRLTKPFSPKITALHVNTDGAFMAKVEKAGFLEMIREKTSYERIHVKVLEEKEPNEIGLLVNDYSTLIGAKLIVVLKENKQFLDRIFNPDTSRKIIRQASIPVLVFHKTK